MRVRRYTFSAALGALAFAQMSHAQSVDEAAATAETPDAITGAAEGENIVITGSRLREESVQDTPLAVSVLSADTVENLHTTDIRGLAAIVPNLNVTPQGATPNAAVVNLRGFGVVSTDISVEPGISIYVDGVYQSIITGAMSNLFDVERIEVLRGPQGTLLGRNASAGAILIRRTRPSNEFEGRGQLEYGTFNLFQAQGLVNVPIVDDVLASKFYVHFRRRENFVENQVVPNGDLGGQDRGSLRAALLFTPTDNFTLYLTGDYQWDRSPQIGARGVSTPTNLICVIGGICDGPDTDGYQVTSATFLDDPFADEYNLTANADWNLGGATVTTILGYRRYDQTTNVDLDNTPLPFLEVFDNRTVLDQHSAELRLVSNEGGGLDLGGRLAWLVAAYYSRADAYQEQGTRSLGTNRTQAQSSLKDTYAVFGQVNFDIIEPLTVTLGARHSWDDVTHRFNLASLGTDYQPLDNTQSASFENTSFEAGLRYTIDATKMVYVRYAEGYRGGGFIGLPGSLAASEPPYGPETSESYEIGARTEFLDRMLQFNLTLFDVRFADLQRTTALAGPNNTFVQTTANVARARTRGVELESVLRPLDALSFRTAIGYLDAKYTRYLVTNPDGSTTDLSGTPFNFTAKWTLAGSVNYRHSFDERFIGFDAIDFYAAADWRSRMVVSNTATDPVGDQPPYALVNLGINFHAEGPVGYSLGLYVNNVFDQRYKAYANNVANLVSYIYDNEGLTAGVTFGVNF